MTAVVGLSKVARVRPGDRDARDVQGFVPLIRERDRLGQTLRANGLNSKI